MSKRMQPIRAFAALLILGILSCFGGVKKTGKVVDYQPGRVITKMGYYQVGELPPGWQRIKLGAAMITLFNESLRSTIATDAFCEQAYDDSPLEMLTRHLFAGLQDIKVKEEKPFMLDGRGALRTLFSASLDGLPVTVDSVVIKKDWCLFDFFLVTPPERHAEASPAFENFFQGFAYTGEI